MLNTRISLISFKLPSPCRLNLQIRDLPHKTLLAVCTAAALVVKTNYIELVCMKIVSIPKDGNFTVLIPITWPPWKPSIQYNTWYYRTGILFSSLQLNGHTIGINPETQKLEPHCTTQGLTVAKKELCI